jgi:predicted Zn-dependent protease
MENATEQPNWDALTVKDVVDAPPRLLSDMKNTAYNLYHAGRYEDAETLLKGLLALEPRDAWSLSLFATMLRKQNKFREALVLMETAHSVDPSDEHIKTMRDELLNFAKAVHEAKHGTGG